MLFSNQPLNCTTAWLPKKNTKLYSLKVYPFFALLYFYLLSVSTVSQAEALSQQNCNQTNIRCVGADQEYTSIQSAAAETNPGDQVLVAPGKYTGFRVFRSGKKSAPIIFKAMGDVLINESAPGSRYGHEEGITIENASYITIDGFRVQRAEGKFKHAIASHRASAENPMMGLQIINNIASKSWKDNIYLSQTAYSLIANNQSFQADAHGFYFSNAGTDHTQIKNNLAYRNKGSGMHFNGDSRMGGDGVIPHLTIENNVIHHNGRNGLNMDGVQDTKIHNNLFLGNGSRGIRGFKIDASAGPKNLTITNNSSVHNKGWDIKLTQDKSGHAIEKNAFLSTNALFIQGLKFSSDHNLLSNKFNLGSKEKTISFRQWQGFGFDKNSKQEAVYRVFKNELDGDFSIVDAFASKNIGADFLKLPKFSL